MLSKQVHEILSKYFVVFPHKNKPFIFLGDTINGHHISINYINYSKLDYIIDRLIDEYMIYNISKQVYNMVQYKDSPEAEAIAIAHQHNKALINAIHDLRQYRKSLL